MDNMITPGDAAKAPLENVEMPVENTGIDVTTGQEGNLFPPGGGETITNTEGLPTGQTAPVNSLFTEEADPVGTSEQPLQEQQPVQTESPVKEDPSRMQYWQSQADKAKNDSFQLQQELEYYKNTMGPIAKVIEQNPQVLDNIDSLTNGNLPPQPVQAGQQQGNSLNRPIRPEKPNSYSEVDAYNDPESDSFRYRSSNEQWRDNMITWYENVETAKAQQQQIAMQHHQKNTMMQSAHAYAMNQYGFDVNKAADFVQWAQNPNNITVDSLVQLYSQKDAPSQQQAQTQRKTQEMQQQQERLKVPRPTAVQTGESAPTLNEEDSFSQALLTNARR
jgi:hypothetical protein